MTKMAEQETQQKQPKAQAKGHLAAVLVRGLIGLSQDKRKTLELLKLEKKHICAVYPDTDVLRGMLKNVEELITWGEVDDKTMALLKEKRGEKESAKKKNPHYHLHPPRGGFERKGIKKPFSQGGAHGYRGEKINALLAKMV